MATLEKRALEQALNTLKGLEAEFWIKLPGGEVYGKLPGEGEKSRERKRKSPRWPSGTLTNYIVPLLEGIVPGEKRAIPCREFGQSLQNTLTGWASKKWGAGTYITQWNREENTLHIMRTL